ncbi:MAG TPA: MauE/DoxX family redox-associated membrane protein [Acidimicrobiia bacterium]|nr:MauE/DoxX family redox-associated membrane protein [Acidimicrobiia bacterium]
MTVLAGPFAIATVVLALGGASKMLEPADTANALRALHLPSGRVLVRVGGAFELVVALAALVTGATVLAAVVALSYAAFAVVVMLALGSGRAISTCGCFGKVDTPPSWVHVVLDLVFAGVAAAAAVAVDSQVALPDVLSHQPLLGIPFVVLVIVGTGLVFLAFTALPKTMAAVKAFRP